MSRDNIVSLGKEWYLAPPGFWGPRDHAKAAAAQPREIGTLPVVAPLPQIANGWFRPKPRRASDNATSKVVDELLSNQGIGRRQG